MNAEAHFYNHASLENNSCTLGHSGGAYVSGGAQLNFHDDARVQYNSAATDAGGVYASGFDKLTTTPTRIVFNGRSSAAQTRPDYREVGLGYTTKPW